MHYYPALPVGRLILTGADRVKFLHNFCTADVKRIQLGELREAFVLNIKGKLHGHAHVLCREESLELISWPNQTEVLRTHLDRFLIREKVAFHSADLDGTGFLFGSTTDSGPLESVPLGSWRELGIGEAACLVAAGEFCGPGWLVLPSHPHAPAGAVSLPFDVSRLQLASESQLEHWRISHGCPRFSVDSSDETLPQELQRDEKAISFDKGCYLGQETVARIDSLGHVNRLLVKVSLSAIPTATLPAELRLQDTVVGMLTSTAAADPQPLGLATVKRAAAKPGQRLSCGEVEVVVL
jgi:folate-binding protein YgfZ